ncbi:MAG: hypothetical protein JRI35_01160 [Deltaproteobacteria bacterium]|nr:hypothetical protein [Deltaproteobacteria bacterium]
MKRLPFSGFQSSLIADRRGSAIRPATRNPAKGKPLLRQGADSNSKAQWNTDGFTEYLPIGVRARNGAYENDSTVRKV